MFVRGEGCLDTALHFLWRGLPGPALFSMAHHRSLWPSSREAGQAGTQEMCDGVNPGRTSWSIGPARTTPQQSWGGVYAFTHPQHQQHHQDQDRGTPSCDG